MLYPFVNAFGDKYQKIVIPGKENHFYIVGDIVVVTPINSSSIFLVDEDIWNKMPWSGWKINKNNYISNCGLLLHRVVAYLYDMLVGQHGVMIDHKNRNRCDCRKENIRICTAIQNGWNSVKKHGHQLKNGKWRFTFSKSYPTMAEAEEGLRSGEFQYMSKNRTCFINETFDTYEEGYQWWKFKAGIHYGEFSPFANPYQSCEDIIKEASYRISENSKRQRPS